MLGTLLGYALALVGRTQEGLGLLEQAVDETRSTRIWQLVFAQEILAQVYLACGREGDAAVTAGDALDASRRIRTRSGEARILVVLADIAASGTVADFDKAQSLYREALDLADELGMRPLIAHCHLGLGKLYRRTGRKPDAESHLALATTLYREMDMRFWLEQAQAEQQT
jgi:tetratricopeptide (TPR) repeat protein